MKRFVLASLIAAAALSPSSARSGSTFLDIGILGPWFQFCPEDDVGLLQLGGIWVENPNVTFLSISAGGSRAGNSDGGGFRGLLNLSGIYNQVGKGGADCLFQIAGLRNYVEGPFSGIEFSLFWNQHQDDVSGLLFSVFANTTDDLTGGSFAFVNQAAVLAGMQSGPAIALPAFANFADDESSGGLQWGFYNYSYQLGGIQALSLFVLPALVNQAGSTDDGGYIYGWQAGFVNSAGTVHGIQSLGGPILLPSLCNLAGDVDGVQFGLVNRAGNVRGVQFGIFNTAKRLRGIQIGLSNFIGDDFDSGVGAHWFPIFNIAFMNF